LFPISTREKRLNAPSPIEWEWENCPLSVGVANVRDILPQLPVPPAYITAAAGGEGFAEMAQRLVEARG